MKKEVGKTSLTKEALVLGGSSGIGKALSIILANNGYSVGVVARRESLLRDLENSNSNIKSISIDLSDTENALSVLDTYIEERGDLDIVVLSAGTGDINPILDNEIDANMVELNVITFFKLMNAFYSRFSSRGKGHIVAISSIGGLRGSEEALVYNASKAFQINFLEGMCRKAVCEKCGVTITDVRPGLVNTRMAKGEGLFWVMPTEKVASQIFKAIKRKKHLVYVTRRWKIIALLLNIIPRSIYLKMPK